MIETYRDLKEDTQRQLIKMKAAKTGVDYTIDNYTFPEYMKLITKYDVSDGDFHRVFFDKHAICDDNTEAMNETNKVVPLERIISHMFSNGIRLRPIPT